MTLVEKIAKVLEDDNLYVTHDYIKANGMGKKILQAILADPSIIETIEFANRVAKTMDDLRSSHVFFVLQQAYGDMDWAEAQSILNHVIEQTDNWRKQIENSSTREKPKEDG